MQKKKYSYIGFLPPYPHVIIDSMLKMGDRYSYMAKLTGALKPLFDKQGFTFADYTDAKKSGAGEGEFIDGFHISEKAMLRVIIDLYARDAFLQKYCDIIQMKNLLNTSKSDRAVMND